MRGYPKHVATKQDFENLLLMPELREQAIRQLEAIHDLQDDTATRAVEPVDPKQPDGEWKVKKVPNPVPLWKRKGFASRKELEELISEQAKENS